MSTAKIYTFSMTPGESYRPSNGTEGRMFERQLCDRCANENPDDEKWCPIKTAAGMFQENEPQYPSEWVVADDGNPTCTAWVMEAGP